MRGRSWRWLRARIIALLDAPPIGWHDVTVGNKVRPEPLWGTRLQSALYTSREGGTR